MKQLLFASLILVSLNLKAQVKKDSIQQPIQQQQIQEPPADKPFILKGTYKQFKALYTDLQKSNGGFAEVVDLLTWLNTNLQEDKSKQQPTKK